MSLLQDAVHSMNSTMWAGHVCFLEVVLPLLFFIKSRGATESHAAKLGLLLTCPGPWIPVLSPRENKIK